MKKIVFLSLMAAIAFASCEKIEAYRNFSDAPTALRFVDRTDSGTGQWAYRYSCYKYNNSWYLDPRTKETYCEVIHIEVWSNTKRPTNRWIDYIEWKKNPDYLVLKGPTTDSISALKFSDYIKLTDGQLQAFNPQ